MSIPSKEMPVEWALNRAIPPEITLDATWGHSGVPIAIFGPLAHLPAVAPTRDRPGATRSLAGAFRRRRVHADVSHEGDSFLLLGSLPARRLAVRHTGRLELS